MLFGLVLALAACVPLATFASSAEQGSASSELQVPEDVLAEDIPIDELALRLTPLTVSELAEVAEGWRELVKSQTHAVVAAQIAALASEGDSASSARDTLTELANKRNKLFERYSTVIDSWEKKGGDAEAIAEFRAYRNSILVEETRTSDWRTLVARAYDWLISADGGIKLAINIVVIVAALFGLLFVARIIRRIIRRHIVHVPNLSKLLQTFVVGVI
jgi:small conductance mechanosensitive channel